MSISVNICNKIWKDMNMYGRWYPTRARETSEAAAGAHLPAESSAIIKCIGGQKCVNIGTVLHRITQFARGKHFLLFFKTYVYFFPVFFKLCVNIFQVFASHV